MTRKVNITPRAKADLQDIWTYTLEIWGEAQADKYIGELFERFEWLAEQPQLGKHRPDVENGYHCFGQGRHLVFYLIRDTAIDIIGVPHESMDIDHVFDG